MSCLDDFANHTPPLISTHPFSHLSQAGYMGVKVYPPSESILSFEWLQNGELNPWWFLYQVLFVRRFGENSFFFHSFSHVLNRTILSDITHPVSALSTPFHP